MDARDLSRIDRGLLYAAVGDRKHFVSLVVKAIVEEHGLDLQIHREGPSYVVVMIETCGDAIVGEHRLPIAWTAIDEAVRFYILKLHLDAVLAGHERWLRRMAPRLAALGVEPIPRRLPAND